MFAATAQQQGFDFADEAAVGTPQEDTPGTWLDVQMTAAAYRAYIISARRRLEAAPPSLRDLFGQALDLADQALADLTPRSRTATMPSRCRGSTCRMTKPSGWPWKPPQRHLSAASKRDAVTTAATLRPPSTSRAWAASSAVDGKARAASSITAPALTRNC